MICIAIVEDENIWMQMLNEYIKRYAAENNFQVDVKCFRDGTEIVKYQGKFDIIFMDIQLGQMNGMKAAEKIREYDKEVIFIFVTNTAAYAVQGYTVDAMGYMLKPIKYAAFAQLVKKAFTKLKRKDKVYLNINTAEGIKRLDLNTIFYIESQRHKVLIHMEDGKYLVSGTMKRLEEELREKGFARCNNAYLVNMKYIENVQRNEVIVGGNALSISRTKKQTFLEAVTDYMGGVV